MKRILFIGDLRAHTRTSQRAASFERAGHELERISTVATDLVAPGSEARGGKRSVASVLSRLRYRIGRPGDETGANDKVQQAIRSAVFDLLWVEKAATLRSETLEEAVQLQPEMQRAFFSEDDMTIAGNQSVWFRRSLPWYDVVFTTKSHNARAEELPRLGARRVEYLTKTFDPLLHRPIALSAEERKRFGSPIGFIGTFEEQRAQALLTLARAGLSVRVWGNGWSAWKGRHPRLCVEGRAVYGEDYVRAVCATDVNLGFLRKESRDQHTDRSVEIPACGGFLLAERTVEHQALFTEGVEADYFRDLVELTTKAHDHLAHPEKRAKIAARGRQRCLDDRYDHDQAVSIMLHRLDDSRRRRAA